MSESSQSFVTPASIPNDLQVNVSELDRSPSPLLSQANTVEDPIRQFSPRVQEAILGVIPSDDPFSIPDFDAIAYINNLFPTEQSLVGLDDAISDTMSKINRCDEDIAEIIHSQADMSKNGSDSLTEAKSAINDLFTKIRDIKAKTDSSELMVKEITRDIKQLDTAKKNLTASITTLNHLHMLLGGVESLESYTKQRQYGDMANLLPGVLKVLEHFERYMHIPQVKQLAEQVQAVKKEIGDQILDDFKTSVAGGRPFNPTSKTLDACRVIAVLDDRVREKFMDWFVDLQLSEYHYLFEDTQDSAWLDRIDQRYTWFKTFLVDFEKKLNACFPPEWDICRVLAAEFCRITAKQLADLMAKRRREVTSNLLSFAINKTAEFEIILSRRFPVETPPQENAEGAPPPQPKKNPFLGMVRKVFENVMDVFTAAQDEALAGLVMEFVRKFGSSAPKQENESGAVNFQSASDLFMFYRKCIVSAGQISLSTVVLKDLSMVFKKYLQEYANRCLVAFLPRISAASAVNAGSLIQSLLKEGEVARLTTQEQFLTCCVLVTAEYCAETTKQLQAKLNEKLGAAGGDTPPVVDMNSEMDHFHLVVASCVQILVQDLESACEPAFAVMSKKQWSSVDVVGDESSYIHSIKSHLRQAIPRLRDNLISARKYFIQLCTKFANTFIPKYTATLAKCRPLSVTGAEQLLLDTHALKTELLNLPNLESSAQRKPPTNYTKLVVKGMSKAEMMLKLVMSTESTADAFVESFNRLLPEGTLHDFQQILDLKGLRRADQAHLLDVYHQKHSAGAKEPPPLAASPTPSSQTGGTASPSVLSSLIQGDMAAQDSRIRKLEKMIKKHL